MLVKKVMEINLRLARIFYVTYRVLDMRMNYEKFTNV